MVVFPMVGKFGNDTSFISSCAVWILFLFLSFMISKHYPATAASPSISPFIMAGRAWRIFSTSQSHHRKLCNRRMVSRSKRGRISFAGVPPTIV